eukprot:360018-Chlamydomonas_euryale.AAC.5
MLAADLEDDEDGGDAAARADGSAAEEGAAAAEGVVLVMGSEGQGLSPAARAACVPVSVPMSAGRMESLNVGVAGGVLMFALAPGGGAVALARRLERLGIARQQPGADAR